jgi:hypothetical protein
VSYARSASLATWTCRSQPFSAFATSFDAFESAGRTLICGRFIRCSFSTWFWCERILLITNVGRLKPAVPGRGAGSGSSSATGIPARPRSPRGTHVVALLLAVLRLRLDRLLHALARADDDRVFARRPISASPWRFSRRPSVQLPDP